ncbi:hypothetical protein UT300007_02320 [Clostridium sp. CTA-7]
MFGLNIIAFIPFILVAWVANIKILKNKKISNILLPILIGISLICSILTTSTTVYVGVALIILSLTIYIFIFSIRGKDIYKNRTRIVVFYGMCIVSLIVVLILSLKVFGIYWETIVDTLKDITVNKGNLQTGHERTNAIKMSLTILSSSPLFGAGWGSFRSLDLTSNLLANTGIIGLCSYIYILFVVIKEIFRYRDINENLAIAFILSITISSIALLISIPDLNYGYYWMMIALGFNYCRD